MMLNKLFGMLGPRRDARAALPRVRDRANLDIVLSWALARGESEPSFPVAYVEFLRTCLEPMPQAMTTVRQRRRGAETDATRRFASLLGALSQLPPLEFALADRLARIANAVLSNASPLASGQWSGDVGAHFEMTSSFGHKGRLLTTIIRFMRCTRCLELGTAYGMSALFILEALSRHGPDTHLTTVEGFQPLYELTAAALGPRYPGRVRCEYGWTSRVLPGLAQTMAPVDFLFHDAGHSRKDYINDFHAALPLLGPGSVVLIDDIAWNDPRFAAVNPRCRAGWLAIARHERVRWAVEINQELGLVLLD